MIGKGLTTATTALLLTGLLAGAIFAAACTSEKEVEVTREVSVTTEVPMNLAETAQAIRDGSIDVGDEYGLAPGQRYHTIHNTVLGIACAACHQLGTLDTDQVVFTAQDVSAAALGPVDKNSCLGCHTPAGPAHELYGTDAP